MEFRFNLNEIFTQPIVEVGNTLIPPGFSGDKRALWDTQSKVTQIVNAMGEASAHAQGLTKPITTADRLRNSEHRLYLLIDQNANNGKGAVTGMLKTGEKSLYVFDREGQHYQVSPPCVLDFYVHESRQRSGFGRQLFQHMLHKEQIEPVRMAIDRPSEKFLGFLHKHYGLDGPVKQMNNYVVFDGFFPRAAELGRRPAVETDGSNTPTKKQSANGLQQGYPGRALGRYGAPRPPCSMGQIIHNDSAVLKTNQKPSGVRSEPVTNILTGGQYNNYQNGNYPPGAWQATQSVPNMPYSSNPTTIQNYSMMAQGDVSSSYYYNPQTQQYHVLSPPVSDVTPNKQSVKAPTKEALIPQTFDGTVRRGPHTVQSMPLQRPPASAMVQSSLSAPVNYQQSYQHPDVYHQQYHTMVSAQNQPNQTNNNVHTADAPKPSEYHPVAALQTAPSNTVINHQPLGDAGQLNHHQYHMGHQENLTQGIVENYPSRTLQAVSQGDSTQNPQQLLNPSVPQPPIQNSGVPAHQQNLQVAQEHLNQAVSSTVGQPVGLQSGITENTTYPSQVLSQNLQPVLENYHQVSNAASAVTQQQSAASPAPMQNAMVNAQNPSSGSTQDQVYQAPNQLVSQSEEISHTQNVPAQTLPTQNSPAQGISPMPSQGQYYRAPNAVQYPNDPDRVAKINEPQFNFEAQQQSAQYSASPAQEANKADRPNSLNIDEGALITADAQPEVPQEKKEEIVVEAPHHEEDVDSLEAVEEEIRNVGSITPKGLRSPRMEAAGIVTPGRSTPGLTDQGYFDLKFYHNKLW